MVKFVDFKSRVCYLEALVGVLDRGALCQLSLTWGRATASKPCNILYVSLLLLFLPVMYIQLADLKTLVSGTS